MYGDIYNSTWWGSGACDNTVNWGLVYKPYANCPPPPSTSEEIVAENGDSLLTEVGLIFLITEIN